MTALQKSDGQTGRTKGPWQTNGSHVYGVDPDRTLVAQVLSGGGRCLPDRDLIAAAPELLEHLVALQSHFAGMASTPKSETLLAILAKADRAITKATGQ